ncbi:hypothetical protein ABIB38_003628 [Massilia sp. UYP11]|uniref:phosphodiester glycosidase family protein n=1 Tax=Massilia sp. UYP11 TaxID=1756385 RepID=UPI003D24F82D
MLLNRVMPVLLLFVAAHAIGAPTPRYATQLEKFSSESRIPDSAMRLRVSVATDAPSSERAVRIGDVLLCSKSNCYRARTTGYVDVTDTSAGTANVVADVVMPVVTITDVYFTEPNGGPALTGHVNLKAPFVMEQGFYGAELLIGVRKQQLNAKPSYIPTQAASSFFNPESSLVHYLPSLQTVAKLPGGAVLTIPAGALDAAQVFHVSVDNVGEMYPRIDIYPYVKLHRPATIDVPSIPGGTSAHEMIVPIGTREEQALWATPNAGPARNARMALPQTGVIKPDILEDSALGSPRAINGMPSDVPSASAGTTCAGYLAQPIVIGALNLALLKTGAVRVKTCEKIRPYVHIVYVNTKDNRIRYSLPYAMSSAGQGNGPYLRLQRIDAFTASPSIAMINGFTWSGDSGTFDNQWGRAEGIVRSNGVALGDNVSGGGAGCPSCKNGGNKFVMAYGGDKSQPAFFTTTTPSSLGSSSLNVVSSSTSIVKNGACAASGDQNRWSAVGAANGRMVFISSTSDGTTSAAELCTVFRAMLIRNALRLDGGPSASLVVSGQLLNELTGLARLKYGRARHIAYPLRISY